ncbi:WSC-domain-containing protein [Auriculariales sp. MPI-PUGE-AT-0066]|nr:WSC-domain-containing protein [Auriculariales sp. MPI-PUGE-AT-0066]
MVALGIATLLFLPLILVGDAHAFFRMPCSQPVTVVRADPIVSDGKVASHLHTVLGSNGFDFSVDYDGLRNGTCSTCLPVADKSAYWTPNLWFQAQNGSFHRVDQVGGATIYYLQRYNSDGDKTLRAFPPGFRMIAGNMTRRNYDPDVLSHRAITHRCLDFDNSSPAAGEWHHLPDHPCPAGIRTQVFFPSCWNGNDLDSADHQTHVVYPDGVDNGVCPSTHPVRLVSLFYEIVWSTPAWADSWWVPANAQQPFVLSNGDPTGYGFHGDFISGWDENILQQAVNQCTAESGDIRECNILEFRTDDEMNSCVIPPRTLDKTEGWHTSDSDSTPTETPLPSGGGYCDAPDTIIPRQDATFINSVANWTSLGCARDDLGNRAFPDVTTFDDMTPEKCVASCADRGFNYAGLQFGRECWCGSQFDASRLGPYPCNMNCVGDPSQNCGASGFLAVTSSRTVRRRPPACSPTHRQRLSRPTQKDVSIGGVDLQGWDPVGCYSDNDGPRTLRGISLDAMGQMSPKICVAQCGGLSYSYAGIEGGSRCHCGNELYATNKLNASRCDAKCGSPCAAQSCFLANLISQLGTGDTLQTCGGAKAVAVYHASGDGAIKEPMSLPADHSF